MKLSLRSLAAGSVLTLGALSLSACSAGNADTAADDTFRVVAAFYPLEYVSEALVGEDGVVDTLAAPGIEAHDLELSPAAVRDMQEADLVIYLSDFQPAVDDAIASTGVAAFDVASVVELHEADHSHEDEAHEDEAHEDEDEHGHGASDPHFWLDPTLLATAAEGIAAEIQRLHPDAAEAVQERWQALSDELAAIDDDFTQGLAACAREDIVVTHEAFGYLAEAYGLHQEGIAGIDPDTEPSPARLREVREFIEASGATTIFAESAADPDVASALARDAGVQMAVLSPLETEVEGEDYAGTMRSNLEALRQALDCD